MAVHDYTAWIVLDIGDGADAVCYETTSPRRIKEWVAKMKEFYPTWHSVSYTKDGVKTQYEIREDTRVHTG